MFKRPTPYVTVSLYANVAWASQIMLMHGVDYLNMWYTLRSLRMEQTT